MQFTKTDLARLEQLLKALRRGKYDLEGEEVLAFAQCFHWAGALFDAMKESLAPKPPVVTAPPPADKPQPKPKKPKT
jgi:hypothetical protein